MAMHSPSCKTGHLLRVLRVAKRWRRTTLVGSAIFALSPTVLGAPQINVGVLPAVAHASERGIGFFGAIAADTLFLRSLPDETGLGPRLEIASYAFDDLRVSFGPTALLAGVPIDLQPALSGLLKVNEGQLSGGLSARLFLGFRPYNHTHPYSAAIGLSAGVDQILWGSDDERLYLLALHLDAMWLSLPIVALISSL